MLRRQPGWVTDHILVQLTVTRIDPRTFNTTSILSFTFKLKYFFELLFKDLLFHKCDFFVSLEGSDHLNLYKDFLSWRSGADTADTLGITVIIFFSQADIRHFTSSTIFVDLL